MDGAGQPDATERRAGRQGWQPGRQTASIHGMKAVDVLVRIDGRDHVVGIDMRRQRQLHQDAMHIGIGVELTDQ